MKNSATNLFDRLDADQIRKTILNLPGVNADLTLRKHNEARRKAEALRLEADRIIWEANSELMESVLEDWTKEELNKAAAKATA